MPDKFHFSNGHRFLIKELVDFTLSKSDEFWALQSRKIKSNVSLNTKKQGSVLKEIGKDFTKMDVEAERKKLLHMLEFFFNKEENKNDYEKNVDELLQTAEVDVSIQEMYDGGGISQGYSYLSKIKCSVCGNINKISKYRGLNEKADRWVISNIKRYIQTHKLKTTNKKCKSKTMKSSSILMFTTTSKVSDKYQNRTLNVPDDINASASVSANVKENVLECLVQSPESQNTCNIPLEKSYSDIANSVSTSSSLDQALDALNENTGEC